jgi:hypothetical protein
VGTAGADAIDSAVASAFAFNVVEPWMCGIVDRLNPLASATVEGIFEITKTHPPPVTA